MPRGTEADITQALGGSFTLQVRSYGGLFRIAGTDADALGKEMPSEARVSQAASAGLEEQVTAALKTCFDPEIPVNIVDLGLVYHCQVTHLPEGGNKVDVKFTLTAPGCGMGQVLKDDMESKILSLSGVKEVGVEVVLDPPWDQSMMSDAAKLQLGMI